MQSRPQSTFDEERLLHRIDELLSQVKQLESEVERTHRLATLGLLSVSIAHEFNNILTPVLSYAQLALAAPDDAEMTRKALRKTVEGTEKAAQIASAMLGFVREDGADQTAAVRAVIDDALRCIGRDLFKEGIALEIDVSRRLQVRMRPISLEQVIVNLVLNAVEAIRPAAGQLRLVADNSSSSTGNTPNVTIRVEDSGRGMSEELLARVFDPFVSAGNKEGRRTGTGLGLTICKRLVEEAGGTISVASKVGEGTSFSIVLPAA